MCHTFNKKNKWTFLDLNSSWADYTVNWQITWIIASLCPIRPLWSLCRGARKWHRAASPGPPKRLGASGGLDFLCSAVKHSLPDLSLPTSVWCVQICVLPPHSIKLHCPLCSHQHGVSQPHCFSRYFLEKLNRIVNEVPLGLPSGSFVMMGFGFLICKGNIPKIWPLPILK